MFRKVGFYVMVVMLVAFSAGISLAATSDDILYYRDAAGMSNYFPPTAEATSFNNATYGNSMIGGLVTGTANGAATNVFVSPNNEGDALIYGYYNVRGNNADLFTITNTAAYGVRARIRFIEPKYSCEVLDFDVCLSRNDVWTSYIMANSGVGTLYSLDTDTPIDYGSTRGVSNGVFSTKFPNGKAFSYGSNVVCTKYDGTSYTITADDTLEGYFVVIAENQLNENGTGTKCGTKGTSSTTLNDNIGAGSVGNVLSGNNYMIDLASGDTYAYTATALADFSNSTFLDNPTDATPNLGSGSDLITGVNFVLTKNTLEGSYFDYGTGTEMVVTFPTRRLTNVIGSSNDIFDDSRVLITAYDDKEASKVSVCEFSPCPPATGVTLPYEVNVLNINTSDLLSTSVLANDLSISYSMGYLVIDLVNALSGTAAGPLAHSTTVTNATATAAWTANGLPAIGYALSALDTTSGWNWLLPLNYTSSVTRLP